MKIGLLGFGTVGKGVYDLVARQPGMEIRTIFRQQLTEIQGCSVTNDISKIIDDPAIDTVVEAIGGIAPAEKYVTAALKAGKNVVTANKALLAAKYDTLCRLADVHQVKLRASAAVGGSIGWLANLERATRVQKITQIQGIFNGTCNYILDQMTRHSYTYPQALTAAQELGYAEANPAADIDGHDTAAKLVISANIAFGISLQPNSVSTCGIRQIQAVDIENFRTAGYVCKLIGTAVQQKTENSVAAFVQPTLLRPHTLAANVTENYNLACFRGQETGVQSFLGQGAGRYPTAYNVLQDLVDLTQGKGFHTHTRPTTQISAVNKMKMRYYLRGAAADIAYWPASEIQTHWADAICTTFQEVQQMQHWLTEHPAVFAAAISETES